MKSQWIGLECENYDDIFPYKTDGVKTARGVAAM